MTDRPRVGVSSCLLGQEVRFNGGIGRELDRARRHDLVARIDAYRRGEEPLSVPVALLAHHASGLPWLAEQTYLRPFPADLRLRHAV